MFSDFVRLPRATLRRLLFDKSIWPTRGARHEVKRLRRARRSQEGALLQIDGSPHDWLEGRGPRLALVAAIDDATGKIVHASFRTTEDMAGYLLMLRSLAQARGLPEALYHDRHTILRSPKEPSIEDELAGKRVSVHVTPGGALLLYAGERRLAYREFAPGRPRLRTAVPRRAAQTRRWNRR